MFVPIIPKGASKPIAPYVHGSKAGDMIYVAGTVAIGPDGNTLHAGDVKAQTRYVIEQIKAVMAAAGGSIDDIAYNMIFIRHLHDYTAMNEVYAEFFGKNPPPRFCIVAELVRPELLVEIASIAHLSRV